VELGGGRGAGLRVRTRLILGLSRVAGSGAPVGLGVFPMEDAPMCIIYIQHMYICIHTITNTYTYIYRLDNNYNIQLNRKQQQQETRPFSHGWYYQPRLKGVGAGADVPPSPGWFTRDSRGGGLLSLS
jgi:hypothetical protein